MRKAEQDIIAGSNLRSVRLSGFYLRNLAANAVALISAMTLNLVTPSDVLHIPMTFFFGEGGWILIAIVYPLFVCVMGLFQYMIQRPLSTALAGILCTEGMENASVDNAKVRLLNLPFIIGLINLITWILLPLIATSLFHFLRQVPWKTALFILFRTMMIGLIAAHLSFFLLEDYARKTLIPLFFPKGRLSLVRGAMKISVQRRIRILYMAGTAVPMIILVGTLLFATWNLQGDVVPAIHLARDLLCFTLALCVIFVLIALRLNFLVVRSIIAPIDDMVRVVEKVKGHDFTQRIQVLSNDEIATLGDAGNAMIAGLAERERIRETFGKYVTPEIRDQILEGRIPLDGERREGTLLFSDLRDFTSYVGAHSPEEAIRSMRTYFTAMQGAIQRHHGLILQYVGDEIESVFGIPLYYDDHADRAVIAALDMRRRLEDLNSTRMREGKTPFRHGIGICTGVVLAGITGSDDRLSYTLIGDTVNLASRIQELTKRFNCDILISEETVKRLKTTFPMEDEEPQEIKGYSKPISVCRIL
jgi:class 3 adenylate cyclase